MSDKDLIWLVEISERYFLDEKVPATKIFLGGQSNYNSTLRATLRVKAPSARIAVQLGGLWINAEKLENCFVKSVVCENPEEHDFTQVDLLDVLAGKKQRVE